MVYAPHALIVDSRHEDLLASLYERIGYIAVGAPTWHGVTSHIPYNRYRRIVISNEMAEKEWPGGRIIKEIIVPFHRKRSGHPTLEDWFKPTKFIVYAKNPAVADRMRDMLTNAGLTAKHIPFDELVARLRKSAKGSR